MEIDLDNLVFSGLDEAEGTQRGASGRSGQKSAGDRCR